MFCNPPANKTNIFERNWSKFNHENFILDYFDINWPNVLKLDMQNVDLSFNNFYEAINAVLDKHAPYQKVKKYILKLKTKPWITAGIQNSIKIKNRLFKNYINKKDFTLKNEMHVEYKKHRNMLSTLTKKSKNSYYDNFFRNNLNDLKNPWKGIRNIISVTKSATSVPNTLSQNDDSITDPIKIANIFNNFFST